VLLCSCALLLVLFLQSYLMVDTHSSLKTTSLGLDLSSTGPSGLNTGRDENIHFLTNLDDDEEVRWSLVKGY